ncbi:MAG: NIL domain-containing protein [Prochlorothrix sp.]|nr:NIL domain-containing protein [Prochlorothrix sp.]
MSLPPSIAPETQNPEIPSDPLANRTTETQLRLRIPQNYHQEPVISHIITQYNLTVNITSALLGANGRGDGWFHLKIQGRSQDIEAALAYMNDLDLELWLGSEEPSW